MIKIKNFAKLLTVATLIFANPQMLFAKDAKTKNSELKIAKVDEKKIEEIKTFDFERICRS